MDTNLKSLHRKMYKQEPHGRCFQGDFIPFDYFTKQNKQTNQQKNILLEYITF